MKFTQLKTELALKWFVVTTIFVNLSLNNLSLHPLHLLSLVFPKAQSWFRRYFVHFH